MTLWLSSFFCNVLIMGFLTNSVAYVQVKHLTRLKQLCAVETDQPKQANKIISENRKAGFEYEFDETIEAGNRCDR